MLLTLLEIINDSEGLNKKQNKELLRLQNLYPNNDKVYGGTIDDVLTSRGYVTYIGPVSERDEKGNWIPINYSRKHHVKVSDAGKAALDGDLIVSETKERANAKHHSKRTRQISYTAIAISLLSMLIALYKALEPNWLTK